MCQKDGAAAARSHSSLAQQHVTTQVEGAHLGSLRGRMTQWLASHASRFDRQIHTGNGWWGPAALRA